MPPRYPVSDFIELSGVESTELSERLQGPMHSFFGLSYANYLVLPRSLIQLMPVEWQERLKTCLEEMHVNFEQDADNYSVQLRDENGRFIKDPLAAYRHPNYDAIAEAWKNAHP